MIETFMWGYWGWGGSTRELVNAFDEAETLRGYEPAVFVDTRARRQVRAAGFRGDAFEKLLGELRHRWMRGLGNQAVLDGRPGIEIVNPKVAGDLLDLVVESDRARRRVIFFCACKQASECHRNVVGQLLVEEARRRKVSLSVSEWPGGTPRRVLARFPSSAALASLNEGVLSVPMPKAISPPIGVSLPWGSYSMQSRPQGDVPVVLGPAIHRQGAWSLPLFFHPSDSDSAETQLQRSIVAYRKRGGYEARFSPASARPTSALWEALVVDAR